MIITGSDGLFYCNPQFISALIEVRQQHKHALFEVEFNIHIGSFSDTNYITSYISCQVLSKFSNALILIKAAYGDAFLLQDYIRSTLNYQYIYLQSKRWFDNVSSVQHKHLSSEYKKQSKIQYNIITRIRALLQNY
ncbi:unnamed protein product (macronuclear) [Paramecium tetraurelia]|uniref:Uncharacterized protein n=1 Tax=Paramecium tetraurelia TaxID=5888 RepID=A0CQ02_PARTE|nr:uncharacterized protein GSPATT00038826001 [Paramecium tetraurelia]CAK72869.1 unnamed protein product [Paramecium tetraurelia]|eukprot:XP_001440266.1 hypothetical protein (macronuclear) [Paramecium tetraurelia strain d4-2]